jgi:hypothetical protein
MLNKKFLKRLDIEAHDIKKDIICGGEDCGLIIFADAKMAESY